MGDVTNHPLAKTIDVIAVGSIVSTMIGWLPAAATVLSIIWFCIQIYESRTFKKLCYWSRDRIIRVFHRRENRWLSAAILGIVVLLIIFGHIVLAHAHDHEHPELSDWYKGLHSESGAWCCDDTEVNHLADIDWESKDGHYRVRVDNEWFDVPEGAVINAPNRDGRAMVWMTEGYMGKSVRCFLAGAEG